MEIDQFDDPPQLQCHFPGTEIHMFRDLVIWVSLKLGYTPSYGYFKRENDDSTMGVGICFETLYCQRV